MIYVEGLFLLVRIWMKSYFTATMKMKMIAQGWGVAKDKAITALCVCRGHCCGPASSQAGGALQ